MRKLVSGLIAGAALLLAGCNFHTTAPESDPALNAKADALYRDLTAGRDDSVAASMSRETPPDVVRAQLPMIRKISGTETPPAPKVTGTQRIRSTDGDFYNVWQDYEYADRVAHLSTRFKNQDGEWKVFGFNVGVDMKPAAQAPAAATDAASPEPVAPPAG